MKSIKQQVEIKYFAPDSLSLIGMLPIMNLLSEVLRTKKLEEAYRDLEDKSGVRRPYLTSSMLDKVKLDDFEYAIRTLCEIGFVMDPAHDADLHSGVNEALKRRKDEE